MDNINLTHLNLSKAGLVFDSRTGDSYQLNESASRIIALFQGSKSPEEAAKTISNEFNISSEDALNDITDFQLQLSIMGLAT